MRVYHRAYDERQDDYEKMWAFLVEDYTFKQDAFIWSTGRLGDWKYGCWTERKLFASFQRRNAELWLNNLGELVGFVISENCDNGFFVFARHGHEFLYPEMLAWLKEHWSDRGAELVTEVHELQTEYLRALEQAGFGKRELVAVTNRYDLRAKAAEETGLPAGFRIVDMATCPDYERKAILGNDAWESREDAPTTFDLLRGEYSRENPAYYPSLDFSVVTEDGLHVSSCVGFPDYRNRMAEVEKVCTHRQYRRMGLAEAVIRHCFHRLHEQGVEYAYITGYSDAAKGLYGKAGGCKSKSWHSYAIATGR